MKMDSTFAVEKLICSGVLNSNTSRCTRLQEGMPDVTFSLDRLYSDKVLKKKTLPFILRSEGPCTADRYNAFVLNSMILSRSLQIPAPLEPG